MHVERGLPERCVLGEEDHPLVEGIVEPRRALETEAGLKINIYTQMLAFMHSEIELAIRCCGINERAEMRKLLANAEAAQSSVLPTHSFNATFPSSIQSSTTSNGQ